MVVSAVGAVVFALLALPQLLVVVLALFAALALIDVAGVTATRHTARGSTPMSR
jgi:hypothetical protein